MPTFTPKEYAKHLRRHTKLRRRQVRAAAYQVALQGVGQGATIASRLGIVDRGTYKGRFKARKSRLGAVLRNDSPHAAIIEYGRRPGSRPPPVAAIVGWVRRKLGIKGKGAERVAFLIARAIGRRGMPAHAVFRKHLNPWLFRRFRDKVRRILASAP